MAILSIGSHGPDVTTLQQELNRQLYPSPRLSVDGAFGRLTRDAVRAFQKNAGLKVDGLVGPMTRAALGMPNASKPFTHRVRLHFRSISLTDVPFNSILAHTQAVYAFAREELDWWQRELGRQIPRGGSARTSPPRASTWTPRWWASAGAWAARCWRRAAPASRAARSRCAWGCPAGSRASARGG